MDGLVKIELGPFAERGIRTYSGHDVANGVEVALLFYALRLRSHEQLPPPSFAEDGHLSGSRAVYALSVAPETVAILQCEADRHSVSLQRILRHAVQVYLAEVDAINPEPEAQFGSRGISEAAL